MGEPAACVNDTHECPMVNGTVPHVGLPVSQVFCLTVTCQDENAAVVGTLCACDGPPDAIVKGSSNVYFEGRQAARMGDETSHGGKVTSGRPKVLIGTVSGGDVSDDDGAAQGMALALASAAASLACKIC